jgi:hypothetical protein
VTTLARGFAVSTLALVSMLGWSAAPAAADSRSLFGDGSVRVLSVGPVRIGPGGSAETRLLLPAVRRGHVQVAFIGEDGQVLARVGVEPPAGHPGPLFPATFRFAFTEGQSRIPLLEITDGTSNTIHSGPSNGIIAILIGLLLPAVQRDPGLFAGAHASSFQLFDAQGQTVLILPYIEQDNLRR